MSDTLDAFELERRARQYWTIDGLPELVMGVLWILWGASWIIGESLPRGAVANVYWTFAPLLLVLSAGVAVWATKRLKTAITFPRGGYVRWKEPTHRQRLTAAATALVASLVLVVALSTGRVRGIESVAGPIVGVVLGVGFIVASVTQRAPHLLVLAVAALVLGVISPAGQTDALNWMLIALGVVTAIVGSARLWWFLRSHPIQHRS